MSPNKKPVNTGRTCYRLDSPGSRCWDEDWPTGGLLGCPWDPHWWVSGKSRIGQKEDLNCRTVTSGSSGAHIWSLDPSVYRKASPGYQHCQRLGEESFSIGQGIYNLRNLKGGWHFGNRKKCTSRSVVGPKSGAPCASSHMFSYLVKVIKSF